MTITATCRYCNRTIKQLYPELEFRLQWGHICREDAMNCTSGLGEWPVPDLKPKNDLHDFRGLVMSAVLSVLDGSPFIEKMRTLEICEDAADEAVYRVSEVDGFLLPSGDQFIRIDT